MTAAPTACAAIVANTAMLNSVMVRSATVCGWRDSASLFRAAQKKRCSPGAARFAIASTPLLFFTMRVVNVLHLAAGNRWTGAAAPAFAEVEALRAAGVEAHYAYVGGYKLEQKLA